MDRTGSLSSDFAQILKAARPQFIFTHNLADKHDTHVGTALKVITAIRSLPAEERPERLFGCEVWRDLDWMADGDKVSLTSPPTRICKQHSWVSLICRFAGVNAMTWQRWDAVVPMLPILNLTE